MGWMYSKEAKDLNDNDPAKHSLRMAREFLDFSRDAEAAGNDDAAASHRRVSDGYLDDAVSKRKRS